MSVQGTKVAKRSAATSARAAAKKPDATKPARKGRLWTAGNRGTRVRSAIDAFRSKGIAITKVEGVRGKWNGDSGGDATVQEWLAAETAKGTEITVEGAKFTIVLQLVGEPTSKPAPTASKPVAAKKGK